MGKLPTFGLKDSCDGPVSEPPVAGRIGIHLLPRPQAVGLGSVGARGGKTGSCCGPGAALSEAANRAAANSAEEIRQDKPRSHDRVIDRRAIVEVESQRVRLCLQGMRAWFPRGERP
jgi:hypothetical protein